MAKFWHTFGSIALGAVTIGSAGLQTVIAGHPAVAGGLAFAWAILGHLLPSPIADTPPATPASPQDSH